MTYALYRIVEEKTVNGVEKLWVRLLKEEQAGDFIDHIVRKDKFEDFLIENDLQITDEREFYAL